MATSVRGPIRYGDSHHAACRADCVAPTVLRRPRGSIYGCDVSGRYIGGEGEGRMIELAILGLLQEAPMHGYELRKELATKLGTIRAAISYGTLYPTLKRLLVAGWISETVPAGDAVPPLT